MIGFGFGHKAQMTWALVVNGGPFGVSVFEVSHATVHGILARKQGI